MDVTEEVQKLETYLETLITDLKQSAMNLDQIDQALEELQKDITSTEELETLYAKEFTLAVDNSSIYDRIEKVTNKLLSLDPSNFKARRLQKEVDKYLRVSIIDL